MLELSSGGLRAGLSEDSLGRRGMDEYQNKRQEGGGQQPDQGARLERQCANITSVYLLSADPALVLLLFFFYSRLLFFRFFSFVSFRRENSDATALVPNG